nr:hypothetical protein [Bacillus sp. ms-22]
MKRMSHNGYGAASHNPVKALLAVTKEEYKKQAKAFKKKVEEKKK